MKFKLEIWVSITAMITAVAAVIVAIIQTQVMREEAELEREHARLSVKPSLLVYSRSRVGDNDGSFAFGIINQGLGPAVIEGFSVSLNDTKMTNWHELISNATDGKVFLKGELRNVSGITKSPINQGMLIPAEKDIVPLMLESDNKVSAILKGIGQKVKVAICYCSIYQECWTADNLTVRSQTIANCQAFQTHQFNDID